MMPLELVDRDRAASAAFPSRREALLHAQKVAMLVSESLPADLALSCWSVYPGVAEAHVYGEVEDDDLDRSRRIHEITVACPQFVYRAQERDLFTSVAAEADIDGVKVRIWDHINRREPVRGAVAA